MSRVGIDAPASASVSEVELEMTGKEERAQVGSAAAAIAAAGAGDMPRVRDIFTNVPAFMRVVEAVYENKTKCNRQFTGYAKSSMEYAAKDARTVEEAVIVAAGQAESARVFRAILSTVASGLSITGKVAADTSYNIASNVSNGVASLFKGATYNGSIATGDFTKIVMAITIVTTSDLKQRKQLFDNYIEFSRTGKRIEKVGMAQLAVGIALITASLWPQEREEGKEDEMTSLDYAHAGLTCAYAGANAWTGWATFKKTGEAKKIVKGLARRDIPDTLGNQEVNEEWIANVVQFVNMLEFGAKAKTTVAEADEAREKIREKGDKAQAAIDDTLEGGIGADLEVLQKEVQASTTAAAKILDPYEQACLKADLPKYDTCCYTFSKPFGAWEGGLHYSGAYTGATWAARLAAESCCGAKESAIRA